MVIRLLRIVAYAVSRLESAGSPYYRGLLASATYESYLSILRDKVVPDIGIPSSAPAVGPPTKAPRTPTHLCYLPLGCCNHKVPLSRSIPPPSHTSAYCPASGHP